MFDGDPEEFLFFTGDKALIDGVADPPIIAMNLFFLRPIRSPVVRQIATRRVDAEGKLNPSASMERAAEAMLAELKKWAGPLKGMRAPSA